VLLTDAARLVSGARTTDLGPTQLQDMDGPEHVHQLVGPGLGDSFPPLRRTAAMPLDAVAGETRGDMTARIDRAAKSLEERITDRVSDELERALGSPFRKRE
jgi:hypothetical protein